jgi:hypothetical protein
VTIAIAAAALVSACAAQRLSDAQQSYRVAAAECTDRHKIKTQREWALCVNKAQLEIMGPVEPHGDLLAQETAYRLLLADQVDRKEISNEQAGALFAKFYSGLVTEANNRVAMQAQINSQNAAANAAAAAAFMNATRLPTWQPQPVIQPQVSTPAYVPLQPLQPVEPVNIQAPQPLYTPPPIPPPASRQVVRCGSNASGVTCY